MSADLKLDIVNQLQAFVDEIIQDSNSNDLSKESIVSGVKLRESGGLGAAAARGGETPL